MASEYSKKLTPRINKRVHPFYIDLRRREKKRFLAVNYHSRLFARMEKENEFMVFKNIPIKGLDFEKEVPNSFPGKNFYCVLRLKINNLFVSSGENSAQIEWVESDGSNILKPVLFETPDNARQTEARIIIGVLVNDGEASAGTISPDFGGAKTTYISQFVTTDLMMTNMVMNGIPFVYPVPFIGAGLNLESFQNV